MGLDDVDAGDESEAPRPEPTVDVSAAPPPEGAHGDETSSTPSTEDAPSPSAHDEGTHRPSRVVAEPDTGEDKRTDAPVEVIGPPVRSLAQPFRWGVVFALGSVQIGLTNAAAYLRRRSRALVLSSSGTVQRVGWRAIGARSAVTRSVRATWADAFVTAQAVSRWLAAAAGRRRRQLTALGAAARRFGLRWTAATRHWLRAPRRWRAATQHATSTRAAARATARAELGRRQALAREQAARDAAARRRAARQQHIARLVAKDRARRLRRRRLLVAVLLSPMVVATGFAATAFFLDSIPGVDDVSLPESTTIYYADGTTPIARIGAENRTVLAFDEMNDAVRQAIVAAEDRTFWTNRGVDLTSVLRASWNNLTGGDLQGASTITQQYARISAGLKGI